MSVYQVRLRVKIILGPAAGRMAIRGATTLLVAPIQEARRRRAGACHPGGAYYAFQVRLADEAVETSPRASPAHGIVARDGVDRAAGFFKRLRQG